ncbi:MAG: NAD-dependent malic enzyme [Planctomycetes bacterium]|nr:NAD-dependent malic enzyme [Planctomycetota bacterium]MCH9724897.1 NAD-dependent malic enzyme [Planctomycetota bacterium]MCH9776856.1 NAD-dependent malic enzyme [Planctomycetota bacterium]MCH9792227.1 NAD-dependent malic enzyme [Planctomycetota bacterium]
MNSGRTPKENTIQKTGTLLIEDPLLNKGTAFTEQERRDFGLLGLLPPHVDTLAEQVARAYEAFSEFQIDIDKHIFLRQLQDENETLFYRLLLEHITEMMPIVYTPIVGLACQRFSHIYRRARGIFISYPERDSMDAIFENIKHDVDVIVVTDGERILGLGDQGVGGMGIPIGKLSLYTLCGGVDPAKTLPIVLDLGTNNQERLDDPRYIGWRENRIKGAEYDKFIGQFVDAVKKRFPDVLLQWEDFASVDAERIIDKYRDDLCTFNDDIQGTAAVTTGTILAAIAASGGELKDQRIVMLGAGSAGVGICLQLKQAMMLSGMSESEARAQFYVIDRDGLLHSGRSDLDELHQQLAQSPENLKEWDCDVSGAISFADVVSNGQPGVLIGATGQTGAFTEEIIREMAKHTERPVIFPLSNPTSRAEATPADLLEWTNGKAVIATGSPFDAVDYKGVTHIIAQCNNSYIFPAMGLGILASRARRVTDSMFMAAAMALKETSPALKDPNASLLPSLTTIREVGRHIASAVASAAIEAGVADSLSPEEIDQRIEQTMWKPEY